MCKRTAAVILFVAVLASFSTSTIAENYGYIPDGGHYLGGGFDPLRPQAVFPLCIASKGECQLTSPNSTACLAGEQTSTSAGNLGVSSTVTVRQVQSKYE